MPLAPLAFSPRTLTLAPAVGTTGFIAPAALRVNPFMGGNLVSAAGAANAILYGASINRNTDLKHSRVVVASANITAAADTVGQTAAAREADGDVSGDLTVALGTGAGQILDSLPACASAAVATDNLSVIVLVNGKPYARTDDAVAPGPGEFQRTDAYTIVIGASTGSDVLKVGTEIDIFIGLNIGACAERNAAGVLIAGTVLTAGVPEERYLGVIATSTDTAGRSVTQLVKSDFVLAQTAAMSLVGVTL